MKKLALFFLLITSQLANAQNLLTFSFEGRFVSGTGVPNFIPSNFNDAGISSSTIGRTGLGISPFGGEAMNCNGVPLATDPVLTSYIEFRVTPLAGKKVNITGIELAMLRSNGTGATKIVLRSSLDNFSTNLGGVIEFVNTVGNTFMVANQNFSMQDITSQIIFRVYPHAGIQNFGTWGLGGRTGNDVIVFGSSSDIVLPISLVKFTAEKLADKVKITWITATEFNNDKFLLEKSIDGKTFEHVAEISGAGTSKELNKYEVIDNEPYKGTSYYRLTQTDFDGASRSFEPVALSMEQGGLSMEQVAGGKERGAAWSIYSPTSQLATFTLTDMNGRNIFSETLTLTEGYQNYQLPSTIVTNGITVVSLLTNKEAVIAKVVIK